MASPSFGGRPGQPRKAPGQFSGIQIMFAAILTIGLFLAVDFSGRISASQPLNDAYTRVQTEIAQLRQEQSNLITQRDFYRSDAYVAQWARTEGRMVLPGELLVIPVPSGAASAEQPTPVQVPVQAQAEPDAPQTVNLWWNLFFDGPPPDFP